MNHFAVRIATDDEAADTESTICRWTRPDRRREGVESIREAVHRGGHEIIVAESGGKIVGVVHFILYPDVMLGGRNSHIVFLLVDEDHRRKGVGSMLLEKAMERAKEEGAAKIHVDTIYPEAEQFYRERGFKDDGVMLEHAL